MSAPRHDGGARPAAGVRTLAVVLLLVGALLGAVLPAAARPGGNAGGDAGGDVGPSVSDVRQSPDPSLLRASWRSPRQGVTRDVATGDKPSTGRVLDRQSVDRSAYISAHYWDVCGDAGSNAIDIRATDIAEDTQAGAFAFAMTACEPWTKDDLRGGSIEWALNVPNGRSDGPDYIVGLFVDRADDEFTVLVLRTPTNDRATWTTEYVDYADRVDGSYGLVGVVPYGALGGAEVFAWGLGYFGPSGAAVDLQPDATELLPLYPSECSTFVEGRLSLRVTDGGRLGEVLEAARRRGLPVSGVSLHGGAVEVRGASDADRRALEALDAVSEARRPVFLRRHATPNDPWFDRQWNLRQIRAPRAWDVATASGLEMAVIDDGVDGARADLRGRVVRGFDVVNQTPIPAGANSDRGGHGTGVASIAGAAGGNGRGIAGVDWGARVVPYRVFDASDCATETVVAEAVERAADRGIPVINISMGGYERSDVLARAVAYALRRGSVIVAASGNEGKRGSEPGYPAAYPGVIAVGATNADGALASYSNRGPYLDVAAPGGGSERVGEGVPLLWHRDSIATLVGTSFAAPHVSAAALLYRSRHPGAGPEAVARAIAETAVDAGPAGRDDAYGHGVLDLAALLLAGGGSGGPGGGSGGGSGGGVNPAPVPAPVARDTSQSCPTSVVPPSGFGDIAESVHAPSIDCVVWWRVASGTSAGRYGATAPVTRAQMATFIANLVVASGGTLPASPPDAFADDDGSLHEAAINRLAAVGIVSGLGGRRYGPSDRVLRGQMATFLVKAYAYRTGQDLTASRDWFGDDDGTTHEPSINRAAEAGLTGGTGSGYGAGLPVNRAAMASFLARLLDLLVEQSVAAPPVA